MKDREYVINLDECELVGIYSLALHVNIKNETYFDRFEVENIPKEIKKSLGKTNTMTNIYRIKENYLIICGYFCIGLIDFMLKGKSLLDYTNIFYPKKYEKNDRVIWK